MKGTITNEQGEVEKVGSFHSMVHSPNACNCQDYVWSKPKVKNPIRISATQVAENYILSGHSAHHATAPAGVLWATYLLRCHAPPSTVQLNSKGSVEAAVYPGGVHLLCSVETEQKYHDVLQITTENTWRLQRPLWKWFYVYSMPELQT